MNKVRGIFVALVVSVCALTANAKDDQIEKPGATGSSSLDQFVNSSFALYAKNSHLLNKVDSIGVLSAAMVEDPVGFSADTGTDSTEDATRVAKATSKNELDNWPSMLEGRSVGDVASGLQGETKAAFLLRSRSIARQFDAGDFGDSTGSIGGEANTLLSKSNALLRDVPKNPLKIKKYMKSLNATKKVLKLMAVEYPEKVTALSSFFAK